MSIYMTRLFARWARKQGLDDKALAKAVREMSRGLFEANLGGNLFKKRIARQGGGKSGGYRTIVASKLKGRWFFLYGFAKNERDNIEAAEELALKELASVLLNMPAADLDKALKAKELAEVDHDA
jgi:hypothetical protein